MANPLRSVSAPKRSQQEICDDANARLWSAEDGRQDVHWFVHNGQIHIGWRR